MRDQYSAEQASQLCGRFEAKLGLLPECGQNEAADMVEKEMEKYEELLECAVTRRNCPNRQQTEISSISRNTVAERTDRSQQEREE